LPGWWIEMENWHYTEIQKDKKHKKARAFVLALHKAGVPIARIDTNSWEDSTPSVYIGRRIYHRFSKTDLKNALIAYRSK